MDLIYRETYVMTREAVRMVHTQLATGSISKTAYLLPGFRVKAEDDRDGWIELGALMCGKGWRITPMGVSPQRAKTSLAWLFRKLTGGRAFRFDAGGRWVV